MSPRARVIAVVSAAAVAAAGATVGLTALTTKKEGGEEPVRSGAPPLVLELGFRTDAEAVALRRAARLYERGRDASNAELREQAGVIFTRYDSLPARIGAALAGWPDGTLAALEGLEREYPRSAAVRLHLGYANFWFGKRPEARAAWRAAERLHPDSTYALSAESWLHPQFFPGRPTFTPSFAPPRAVTSLPPARQVAALARRARHGGVRAKLLYGVALQRTGRPVSAERVFAEAARLAPDDPDAQTAAAVGRFDKDDPAAAFSRLGPLTRRFPQAATVRFHLGLLLLWSAQVEEGRRQLRLAQREQPGSVPARQATRFLEALETGGFGAGKDRTRRP